MTTKKMPLCVKRLIYSCWYRESDEHSALERAVCEHYGEPYYPAATCASLDDDSCNEEREKIEEALFPQLRFPPDVPLNK